MTLSKEEQPLSSPRRRDTEHFEALGLSCLASDRRPSRDRGSRCQVTSVGTRTKPCPCVLQTVSVHPLQLSSQEQ